MPAYKFILTRELGKLARWLRILGFDTLYYTEDKLGTLIIEALRGDRIIVTRRREKIDDLQKRTVVVSANEIQEQLRQVIRQLQLPLDKDKMFSRCVLCNTLLRPADKHTVREKVPLYVFATQEEFMVCPECGKVYWPGSHWGKITSVVEQLTSK